MPNNHIDKILEIDCKIEPILELIGEVSNNINISSDISSTTQINGEINTITELIGSFFLTPILQVNNIQIPKTINNQIYDGAYVVIPSINGQTLNTDKKVMTRDIIVEEIPTFWTQNSTGMTFIIGN